MTKYGISPFDNDSARFAHNCIYSRALKIISKQMEELALTSKLEESMLGHMFILAIDLARFPTEQHKFTQTMNDEWQEILRNYVGNNHVQSETLAKTVDVILKHFFFRNTPKGYEIGFNEIAYLDFPERKVFIALAIDVYFDSLLEYIEIAFEDEAGLGDWQPDRMTIPAYLDLYVSWAMEVPEKAKGRVTKEQFERWKVAYYDWFEANCKKIPKKYRTIEKINMDELFEEFAYYAV
ncbi:hypothetical protein [Streptococcus gordonii]|uniref:hypothetical protein n=1 Tax=Streptococcus gordonii TaxID=1302 RepID=UPI001C8C6C72|nr:hypothetical protein [Streptococcus gordonii]MBX9096691.1 hypothetical protein [Streptococcus gordonii]